MRTVRIDSVTLALACAISLGWGSSGCTDEPGSGSTCPAATAAAIPHSGTISASETWSAASPHLVSGELTIASGATVTVEPCAEVRMKKDAYLMVRGKLVARGEETRPIAFRRDNDAERFASLWIRAPGSAELAYATITGGGALPNTTWGAAVIVEGSGFPPATPLLVDHVTVADSAGYGIWLRSWAGFAAGSQELTVKGAGQASAEHSRPVRMSLNAAGTLPTGTYTGNATDEIQLVGESPNYQVTLSETIRARGVPYQVGGGGAFGIITVRGGSGSLTVEPGVTVKFFSSSSNIGGLFVDAGGTLVAAGTASQPIVFTGAGQSPVAGAWEGITFTGTLASGNKLEHVKIEAAGAHGGDTGFGCPPTGSTATDGALKIFTQPGSAFLKSSTISSSSSHGVYRAWTGGEVDFLPTNTFQSVAGCTQVLPKPSSGPCPSSPPCPK